MLARRHNKRATVPSYCFSVHRYDGSCREIAGFIELGDDLEALDFGRSVITDLMRGEPAEFIGCIIRVANDERTVFDIPFAESEPSAPRMISGGRG